MRPFVVAWRVAARRWIVRNGMVMGCGWLPGGWGIRRGSSVLRRLPLSATSTFHGVLSIVRDRGGPWPWDGGCRYPGKLRDLERVWGQASSVERRASSVKASVRRGGVRLRLKRPEQEEPSAEPSWQQVRGGLQRYEAPQQPGRRADNSTSALASMSSALHPAYRHRIYCLAQHGA